MQASEPMALLPSFKFFQTLVDTFAVTVWAPTALPQNKLMLDPANIQDMILHMRQYQDNFNIDISIPTRPTLVPVTVARVKVAKADDGSIGVNINCPRWQYVPAASFGEPFETVQGEKLFIYGAPIAILMTAFLLAAWKEEGVGLQSWSRVTVIDFGYTSSAGFPRIVEQVRINKGESITWDAEVHVNHKKLMDFATECYDHLQENPDWRKVRDTPLALAKCQVLAYTIAWEMYGAELQNIDARNLLLADQIALEIAKRPPTAAPAPPPLAPQGLSTTPEAQLFQSRVAEAVGIANSFRNALIGGHTEAIASVLSFEDKIKFNDTYILLDGLIRMFTVELMWWDEARNPYSFRPNDLMTMLLLYPRHEDGRPREYVVMNLIVRDHPEAPEMVLGSAVLADYELGAVADITIVNTKPVPFRIAGSQQYQDYGGNNSGLEDWHTAIPTPVLFLLSYYLWHYVYESNIALVDINDIHATDRIMTHLLPSADGYWLIRKAQSVTDPTRTADDGWQRYEVTLNEKNFEALCNVVWQFLRGEDWKGWLLVRDNSELRHRFQETGLWLKLLEDIYMGFEEIGGIKNDNGLQQSYHTSNEWRSRGKALPRVPSYNDTYRIATPSSSRPTSSRVPATTSPLPSLPPVTLSQLEGSDVPTAADLLALPSQRVIDFTSPNPSPASSFRTIPRKRPAANTSADLIFVGPQPFLLRRNIVPGRITSTGPAQLPPVTIGGGPPTSTPVVPTPSADVPQTEKEEEEYEGTVRPPEPYVQDEDAVVKRLLDEYQRQIEKGKEKWQKFPSVPQTTSGAAPVPIGLKVSGVDVFPAEIAWAKVQQSYPSKTKIQPSAISGTPKRIYQLKPVDPSLIWPTYPREDLMYPRLVDPGKPVFCLDRKMTPEEEKRYAGYGNRYSCLRAGVARGLGLGK